MRTGDTYAWTGHGNGSTAFTQSGLNQQITIGGSAATWDSKGNLTSEPQSAKTYGYSSENMLTSASGGVTLAYDPALRLYQVAGGSTTRFAYDGLDSIAEYDGSNALQRRFVFGPGIDQPIVQYEGSGTSDRRFMGADERGSVISLTDSSGTLLTINRYDEYGKPQATNAGRFQYTGQKWIGEIGAYDYKARVYLPNLGTFAQTDPIGYAGSPNLYAYVLNDPVNLVDPLGLCNVEPCTGGITIIGSGAALLGGGNGEARQQRFQFDEPIQDGGGDGGFGHDYPTKNPVCARALSTSEMKDLLSRFAVPGHAGQALTSGIYWAWWGIAPGGRVTATFSRGGLRVTNVTIPGEHIFAGQIQRDIFVENGQTVITTHGWGNAQSDSWDVTGMLRDVINQAAGPQIFNALDKSAATYAKAHFKGC